MIPPLVLLVAAFVLGSIPTGLWISRLRGVDLKKVGSGNIGFTNVWRAVGKPYAVITLLGDVAKGAGAAGLLPSVFPNAAAAVPGGEAGLLLGGVSVLGHCFTPFAQFRGGKGVATSLGVFLVLAPIPTLLTFLTFLVIVSATRYISLGSLLGAVVLPALIGFTRGFGPLFGVAALVGVLVIARHWGNLRRLLAGTESRFQWNPGTAKPAQTPPPGEKTDS
jgi:glycerol-3-phosphate acyltransferase PlsY